MNEPSRRGPIARTIVGIWDAMNFTRRLVFNLVFFALLILFLMFAFSGGSLAPLNDRTTLVIAPEGRLVEQFSSDVASRALSKAMGDGGNEEVQLRDLLRALDAAAKDKRIERVYVRFDRLQPTGYASLRELAAALCEGARIGQAGRRVRRQLHAGAIPARRAGQRGVPGSDGRPGARRPRPLSPVLPRRLAGQARRRRAPVQGRRIQVGRRALRARRRVAAGEGSRPVLDERRVAALPRRHRQGARSVRAATRRRHRHAARRPRRRARRSRRATRCSRSSSTG